MPTVVADCPRCGAKQHTFDVSAQIERRDTGAADWCRRFEIFSVCRNCTRPTLFVIELTDINARNDTVLSGIFKQSVTLNKYFRVLSYISLSETVTRKAPEHTPTEIAQVFDEASVCLAVNCFNAAGAMYRLCLDMATRRLLPPVPEDGSDPAEGQPNRKQRRDLGLRIPWLLANGLMPSELADFAEIIREDGNDGAHAGILTKEDAEDLADFAEVLLERLYTEPGRIEIARARRIERRGQTQA